MIHLHNNLSSALDPSTAGINKPSLPQSTLESFRNSLSDAVSSTLTKFGIDPKNVQVSVGPVKNPTTPAGARNPSSTTPGGTTPPPSTTPENTPYNPFAQAANYGWSGIPVPAVNSTATPPAETASNPTLAFDNAYWAQQPAAVQALRNMQNPEQRTEYAQQLASEGYSIDVPIMVWGWDPSMVTSMRQQDGYTWVPSAMQSPVEMAPGLGSMGTLAAYDPNNPPSGSIAVS